jgi:hypothetical protein
MAKKKRTRQSNEAPVLRNPEESVHVKKIQNGFIVSQWKKDKHVEIFSKTNPLKGLKIPKG